MGEFGHGLALEHVAWGDDQSGFSCPADELDGDDAVSAEVEKVVVDADVGELEDFGEEVAEE
ncbi:hypothetical protein QNN03_37860, partial [Streptomyces sp. GXMU-J15]